jgi:hypothetical protein
METRDRPLGNLAQKCLELAERHLDGIEIGRVLRQVARCRPCLLDRLPYTRDLVGSGVIHHDDIGTLERWNQALFDVGQKHLSGQPSRTRI